MLIARSTVLLFMALVPVSVVWSTTLQGHDFARVAQVLLSVICAGATALWFARRNSQPATPLMFAATAFIALALASLLAAPDVVMAGRELALLLGLAGVAAVVASARNDEGVDKVLTAGVSVAAALYSALVLMFLFINLAHSAPLERFGVFVGYDNYRFFNHVQTAMLPLLVIATLQTFRRGALGGLAWFGLVTGFSLLAFSAGRGTVLGLLSGTLLSLLLFRRGAVPVFRHLSIGAVLGLALYLGLFVGLPSLVGDTSVDAVALSGFAGLERDNSRLFLWKLALAATGKAPWLGIGPMHFANEVNGKAAHPHNVYLQIAAEWGVPMLFVLLVAIGWGLWRLARAIHACSDPKQRSVGIGLFVAAVAIAVDAVFSGNFVMPVSQVWIAFVIGWAMSWTRGQRPLIARAAALPSTRRWIALGFAAAVFASQIWLCASVWPELRRLDEHLKHVNRDLSHGDKHRPRFWSDGWF